MDELLSDKEQLDRVRQWWRENGWFLIGGLALGALGIFGWRQYEAYQDRQAEQASALYLWVMQAADADNLDQARAAFDQLRAEFPRHAYTHQAGLLVASEVIVTDPQAAADDLRFVLENSSDPELAMIARVRLARVLAYREQYDEALRLLTVDQPGQFAGRIDEIKGDIYVALGRTDDARAAYLAALVAPGAEVLDRSFLQMKLGDLTSGAPSTPAVEAPPAAPEAAAPEAAAPEATESTQAEGA